MELKFDGDAGFFNSVFNLMNAILGAGIVRAVFDMDWFGKTGTDFLCFQYLFD